MKPLRVALVLFSVFVVLPRLSQAKAAAPAKKDAKSETKSPMNADTWSGLSWRSIGPAVTEGRVVDIAVDPTDHNRFFVAAASGGVWKTVNGGTTYEPVFDGEGSYSIGCVTIDAKNPAVVWVGTGENNSQRAVAYGDGVYKSEDGGKSWKNMGLKDSQHIGRILIDPRNSNIVYVASQGPLWNSGGDRGLYKTTDGGKTWKAVLSVSENTGVTELLMDPRDPDVLYAAAYQRRRHEWTLIDGGPESAIYKSTDAGATWNKVTTGLPKEDMGRVGMVMSPANPDVIYAIIEAANKTGGFFRSNDRGATWEKRSDHVSGGAQAYNEIVADPKNVDHVYEMDTYLQETLDGGKTFKRVNETNKHIDNHAMWIDPSDSRHLLVGDDGGVYESVDGAATWLFKANLPITQFYRVTVDNATPYYNVYGGTQDNFSLAGPSQTPGIQGITNSDWFVTSVGDGFVTAVDPEDPNIIYSEAQYGAMNRMDRRTGEQLYIQPQAGKGGEALRWNWDSPLIISPHSHTRLYFAAQRLFRSDDRGNTWKAVSGDLSRHLDRNSLPVMGKIWPADAVAKNNSTSLFGNIVSISESPVKEGLLYVGTDDGLVQVSENGGGSWRKEASFPGVPDMSYVSHLSASSKQADVVYASFQNYKKGDFKPYVLRSGDRGKTWTSIAGDLPARGSVYTVVDDPVDETLLFAGTEFGIFFTKDGGAHWIQLKGGIPTIAVRDIAIQKRESDLALGTFGRGFYVLDDYTPLRAVKASDLEKEAAFFPIKPVKIYVPPAPLGLRGKAFQGDSYYAAPNPPFGAVFTYYLKDGLKTKVKQRHEAEKEAEKKGQTAPYPSLQQLREEADEEAPAVIATITDADDKIVRRLTIPADKGIHRVAWDLRHPAANPSSLTPQSLENPFVSPIQGPLVVPGVYKVAFSKRVEGKVTPLSEPLAFEASGAFPIPESDRRALLSFEQKTARLQRAVLGAIELSGEVKNRLALIKQALLDTPAADPSLSAEARDLEARLRSLSLSLDGDPVAAARQEGTVPSISDRVGYIVGVQWTCTTAPTQSSLEAYRLAADDFGGELAKLKALVEVDLKKLESKMEVLGAPWTPGRIPDWKKE